MYTMVYLNGVTLCEEDLERLEKIHPNGGYILLGDMLRITNPLSGIRGQHVLNMLLLSLSNRGASVVRTL